MCAQATGLRAVTPHPPTHPPPPTPAGAKTRGAIVEGVEKVYPLIFAFRKVPRAQLPAGGGEAAAAVADAEEEGGGAGAYGVGGAGEEDVYGGAYGAGGGYGGGGFPFGGGAADAVADEPGEFDL